MATDLPENASYSARKLAIAPRIGVIIV